MILIRASFLAAPVRCFLELMELVAIRRWILALVGANVKCLVLNFAISYEVVSACRLSSSSKGGQGGGSGIVADTPRAGNRRVRIPRMRG